VNLALEKDDAILQEQVAESHLPLALIIAHRGGQLRI
jgi:hypothetical protein